ncbi:MAG: hypothetical protein Kow0059_04520 [Candidatus Sumerlaeia bacterium]
MAHAYTPGLQVVSRTTLRKQRLLPIPGEVVVQKGDAVKAETVVARADVPSDLVPVNVVNQLGIEAQDLPDYMLKREGDPVREGEPIAENKPLIKWFKTQIKSPITGTIESVSRVTGQVILRKPPRVLELKAYIDGTVVEVTPRMGVVIETEATFIQGILGVGGETNGEIVMECDGPEDDLTAQKILPDHRGKILVGGAFTDYPALKKALETGVRGIIVGGLNAKDLTPLLGYELGVAITGDEDIALTLILTEGFGRIAMARRTFDLLKRRAGSRASISGRTQIRAGVMRPEIIIPVGTGAPALDVPRSDVHSGVKEGDEVRIIREPYFGRLGRVRRLPPELQTIDSGARVRVMEIELDDGAVVTVPRANVEIIEV